MPTQNFLDAASAANRKPVILMAVESIDALKQSVTTDSEWLASKSNTRAHIADNSVDLKNTIDAGMGAGVKPDHFTFTIDRSVTILSVTAHVRVEARVTDPGNWDKIDVPGMSVPLGLNTTGGWIDAVYPTSLPVPTPILTNPVDPLYADAFNKNQAYIGPDTPLYFVFTNRLPVLAGSTVIYLSQYMQLRMNIPGFTSYTLEWWCRFVPGTSIVVTFYDYDGSLQTKTIDLGTIPTQPSRFETDDIIPSGCTLAYTARGSNDGTTWTALGAKLDGDSLAAYRYYDFTAAFGSNGSNTPTLEEIRVIGGNSQYDYYSTHKDQPIQGAKPYIMEGGISSLTSKIDLLKPATTGEITAKLFWRKKTGDMITTGYLKNKAVICKLGFQGLSESDFEPYFTGTWFDYSADGRTATIDVKTRDVWKKFKLMVPDDGYFLDPTATQNVVINGTTYKVSSGKKLAGTVYTLSGNVIQKMLDIIDLIGAPDRYIDRAAFTALRDGSRSGVDWNVSRALTEPTSAEELLNELAVSAGAFIYPLPSGKMTITLFDDAVNGTPAATFDANRITFKPIDGGQKELTTRVAIYYQIINGKSGGSKDDYLQVYAPINADAEINWNEHKGMEWLDKWGMSTNAIQKLAQRLDGWFANPKFTVRAENVPPRYMGVNRGAVVAVDNLELPCTAANWDAGLRYTSQKKFLVMSKTVNPKDLTLSFDLLEVGPTTSQLQALPDYPAYQLFPPITALTLTEKLALTSTYSVDYVIEVAFTQPTDFHFGGAQIWYKKGAAAWAYHGKVDFGGPDTTRIYRIPAELATTYQVAVLTINSAGLVMPLASAPTATITTATTPPAPLAPTALTATGVLRAVKLVLTCPYSKWLDIVEIHRSATNDRATATLAVPASGPLSIDPNLTAGQTFYYWAKVKDIFGQYSGWYPASATAGVAATVQSESDILNSQIQIGGRNLVKGTGNGTGWTGVNYSIDSSPAFPSLGSLSLYIPGGSPIYFTSPAFSLVQGKQYTLSFWGKSFYVALADIVIKDTSDWSYILYQPNVQIGGGTGPSPVWGYQTFTFTALRTTSLAVIQIVSSSNASFFYSALKIEEGNKATSWTPAPEDVDAGIAQAGTTAAWAGVTGVAVTTDQISVGAVTDMASNTTDVSAAVPVGYTYYDWRDGLSFDSPAVDALGGKILVSVAASLNSTAPALIEIILYEQFSGSWSAVYGASIDINIPTGKSLFSYTWMVAPLSGARAYKMQITTLNSGVTALTRSITVSGVKK